MPLTDQLPEQLSDLLDDLSDASMLWQLGAVLASVLFGWLAAWLLERFWRGRRDGASRALRLGVDGFARVVAPLLAVGLLSLARVWLARHHIHVNIVKVAIPLLWSLGLIRIAFYVLHRAFARRSRHSELFVTVEKSIALLVWAGVALYILGWWPDIYDFLDDRFVPLGRKNKVSLADLLQASVSVVVLLILALWAGAALDERLMRMQALHSSLRVVLARTGRALLIFVAVLVGLHSVGVDLTVLSVFGGAFGVGLGLGMQRIASNYVSGFIILLERSLSIGDMISVDKYTGKVTQINTRYTVLHGLDGVETVLPNEMLISGPVLNQTLSARAVRASTRVPVAYGSDLDKVMPLLIAQAVGTPRVLDTPPPGVSLSRFGPEGYELDLGFWIGDPENGQGGVVSEVNKKIYALVQSGEIQLGFPSMDTHLLDAHIATVVARITQPAAPPPS
jgi:small-conductance mechanosensitive channel